MTNIKEKIGERIFQAVSATWGEVGCNTNLGIILLAAPLIQTAFLHNKLSQEALKQTLQKLTVDDARFAFQAIQLASPAGLGEVAEHDVQKSPDVTLLKAMQVAAGLDRQSKGLYAADLPADPWDGLRLVGNLLR
mgnify:CR=1 FL=1